MDRIIYNTSFPFKYAIRRFVAQRRLTMSSYILKLLREAYNKEIDLSKIISTGKVKHYGDRIVIICTKEDKDNLRDMAKKYNVCMTKIIEDLIIADFERINYKYNDIKFEYSERLTEEV